LSRVCSSQIADLTKVGSVIAAMWLHDAYARRTRARQEGSLDGSSGRSRAPNSVIRHYAKGPSAIGTTPKQSPLFGLVMVRLGPDRRVGRPICCVSGERTIRMSSERSGARPS